MVVHSVIPYSSAESMKIDCTESTYYCIDFKTYVFYCILLIDVLPVPNKIRRMVEILRSDVVQGLGVKLLEKVYSIMEEEDEAKREVNVFHNRIV